MRLRETIHYLSKGPGLLFNLFGETHVNVASVTEDIFFSILLIRHENTVVWSKTTGTCGLLATPTQRQVLHGGIAWAGVCKVFRNSWG